MAKSESDIFTPRTGQVIQAENGTQYCSGQAFLLWYTKVVTFRSDKIE